MHLQRRSSNKLWSPNETTSTKQNFNSAVERRAEIGQAKKHALYRQQGQKQKHFLWTDSLTTAVSLLTSTQARQNRSTEASPSRSSSIALCRSSGRTHRSARPSSPTPSPPDASPWAAGAAASSRATGPLEEVWLDEGPSRSLSIWERAAISTSHTSASFCHACGGHGWRGSKRHDALLPWSKESCAQNARVRACVGRAGGAVRILWADGWNFI